MPTVQSTGSLLVTGRGSTAACQSFELMNEPASAKRSLGLSLLAPPQAVLTFDSACVQLPLADAAARSPPILDDVNLHIAPRRWARARGRRLRQDLIGQACARTDHPHLGATAS